MFIFVVNRNSTFATTTINIQIQASESISYTTTAHQQRTSSGTTSVKSDGNHASTNNNKSKSVDHTISNDSNNTISPTLSFTSNLPTTVTPSTINNTSNATGTGNCSGHGDKNNKGGSGSNENKRVCQRLNSQSCMAILGTSTTTSNTTINDNSSLLVSHPCYFGADSLETHLMTIFELIHTDKTVDEPCKHLTRW